MPSRSSSAEPNGVSRDTNKRRRSGSQSRSHDSSREPEDKRARVDPDWGKDKQRPDPYGLVAREITRIIDMFWEPREVILAGVHLLSLDSQDEIDTEVATATGKQKQSLQIALALARRLPDFYNKLEQGEESWEAVRRRLEHGKSAAKTEDNHTFKRWVSCWRAWNPPLKRLRKTDRGLMHEECARLLCPITVDWTDEVARQKFRVENEPPMTADDWPALTWENGKANLDYLRVGLLRGELLFKAGRALLFPPSIANADNSNDNKSNRRPKAIIYGMKTVTPGFLAYTAVMLRYTLSAETLFLESGGPFNYRRYYNDLVSYLKTPEYEAEINELVEWWNDRMFPPEQTEASNTSPSMLARLHRQHERDVRLERADRPAGN